MNKYRKLATNSTIIAMGTFLSKILVFLLLPLYSSVMSTEEYGIADIVAQSANLLYPLITLGICNAVFRFTYGSKHDDRAVFTVGILTLFVGLAIFILILPLLNLVSVLSDYLLILGLYVFMYGIQQICSQFVRGRGLVTLYAKKGVICTIATLLFNIIFLLIFKLNIVGYLLANVVADFVTTVYMFIKADLSDAFEPKLVKNGLVRNMLKYCIPLIPTTIFWWITNMSDRYLVLYMIDESAEGIYAMAYKIPNIVLMLTTVFNDAWQMSLVEEAKKGSIGKFFTRIFESFKSAMFIAASGLILMVKPITKVLLRNDFYDAWKYTPYLIIACVLTAIVTFVAVIYLVNKKSVNSLICATTGAISNIILNLILIKPFGINGAAIATLISYFIVYVLTTYRSLIYVKYNTYFYRTCLMIFVLIVQAVITIIDIPGAFFISLAIFAAVFAMNFKRMMFTVAKVLKK